MKKFILATLVALSFAGICRAQAGKMLYKADYSSSFTMADPSYSEKVLTLWKDYENNTLDKHADMISDTVTMLLADGTLVKGKANNMAGVKDFRGSIKNLKVKVDAWMSIKSLDRDENLVCVWGNETFTDKDGKQVSRRMQEVWGFNSAGKVSLMLQYVGQGSM
ncbi:hypothetical protein ACPPVU_16420 [Mucilaginibacter sp. McL0603]|uniref:hypothetical protein n=1 Tax=Mucilaginibacter sp. McL0603 TaxID=3415670 RepID=UPI003CE8AA30